MRRRQACVRLVRSNQHMLACMPGGAAPRGARARGAGAWQQIAGVNSRVRCLGCSAHQSSWSPVHRRTSRTVLTPRGQTLNPTFALCLPCLPEGVLRSYPRLQDTEVNMCGGAGSAFGSPAVQHVAPFP